MLIYLIPFISAFIGYFTNWIAIKMLFHPKEPIYILSIKIQGIFPKRQEQFAKKLGVVVANELLHFDEIAEKLKDPEQLKSLTPTIEQHLDEFLEVRLKEKIPVIAMFVTGKTLDKIKDGMMEEIEMLLPDIITQYSDSLGEKINIEQMVTDKVAGFSSDKLEDILFSIMKKEFRFVEILGGVVGFIIGLLQVGITLLQVQ